LLKTGAKWPIPKSAAREKSFAPLLYFSVRGVEISRYRLRKKLDLDAEANLTDFLLGI